MKKTIIFVSNKEQYYFPFVNREEVVIDSIWKEKYRNNNTIFIRICRKLHLSTSIFFGDWKKQIKEYDKVIILDGPYDKLLAYYLNRVNKRAEKYVFCWNTSKRLGHIFPNEYKVYTFDPKDSKELQIPFLPTFYDKSITLPQPNNSNDVLFVGKLKERKNIILSYYELLTKANITTFFYLVGDADDRNEICKVNEDILSYPDYLQEIANAKAILDIANEGQEGLSMRIMECLFFDKKCITNNKSVVRYNFYHPNNILVIDDFNLEMDRVKEFLSAPMKNIPIQIKEDYDIVNWTKKFKEGNI